MSHGMEPRTGQRIKHRPRKKPLTVPSAVQDSVNPISAGKPIPYEAFATFCNSHTRECGILFNLYNINPYTVYKHILGDSQKLYNFKNCVHFLEYIGKCPELLESTLVTRDLRKVIAAFIIEIGLCSSITPGRMQTAANNVVNKLKST